MEANIQRLEPLLTGPSGYLALAASQDGPNPKHQIISRFQAYVSRYGAKDTTVATTKRSYASEKLPPLDSGDDGAKDNLEKDVARAQRALDAATKTAERLEKESDEAQCKADDETKRVASSGKELAAYNSAIRNRDSSAEKAQKHEAKAKKERAECAKLKASQTRKLEQRLEAVTKVVQTCAAGAAALHGATATVAPALAERDFARDLASKAAEALQDKEQETIALQDAAKKAMAAFDALKNEARGLKDKAEEIAPQYDAALMAQLEELPATSAEVEAILDAERKEASQIHEDRGLQKRVEELQAKRDDIQGKVDNMEGADQQRQDALAQLKGPWESTLRNALTSLKAKFADYMDTLGARGDVELVEQATFARWGLAIKVAFRDACDLRQLDAQVQSGGERSVSTIMYLMALQALLPSPFRVVDEINQGMDETNERIVFRRVVLNSTGAGAPQYWLITPKLLQGLYDMEHPDVRVLIVYNGAHNVKRPQDWDLDAFKGAKRRLVAAG
jgi:chromosome segregation ATPase